MNAIEDTLLAIAAREKEIQNLTRSSEFSGNLTQRQAILAQLDALQAANNASKDEANRMRSRMRSYQVENEQLKKMMAQTEDRIIEKEKELEEAQTVIDDLRGALNKMEAQLLETSGELATTYSELKDERDRLAATNAELQQTVEELQNKTTFINQQARGYIACGTKQELRRAGILSRLNVKLTKEYQDAVQGNSTTVNYFESDEFACGDDSAIIEVLPERSSSSYEVKGNKLIVKDAKSFWATDKIVVLVKD